MTELSRRAFLAAIAAAAPLALAACSGASSQGASSSGDVAKASASSSAAADASSAGAQQPSGTVGGTHVIGVAVYNPADNEVRMFKSYLIDYVAGLGFDDVRFMYSGAINSEEGLISFIKSVADQGGAGVMSFTSLDLKAEVEECASHGMYYMLASGTVSEDSFSSVADNEYFLGSVGPGVPMEYAAGTKMVQNYVANKVGNKYFVMSGGAALGNEMHYQRTLGVLDALEAGYGINLGDTKELAGTADAVTATDKDVTVTIAPGYVSRDEMKQAVLTALKADSYEIVLSALPVGPIMEELRAAKVRIAQVDCYSEDNLILFNSGQIDYIAGKYGSLVGPSFAAMYNAVTGHAADFREDGKAFKIVQRMWESSSKEDYDEKYELASNAVTPAYNLEDIYSVCIDYTPTATMDDLKTLAQASSYEECKARRAES